MKRKQSEKIIEITRGFVVFYVTHFCHLIHKGKVSCREGDNSLGPLRMLIKILV